MKVVFCRSCGGLSANEKIEKNAWNDNSSCLSPLQSDDSDDGVEWQETGTESSTESVGLQYLYIQMEYCEKSTLRNVIDEGLHQDKDRVWRLFREIVEGLAHIHTQVTSRVARLAKFSLNVFIFVVCNPS